MSNLYFEGVGGITFKLWGKHVLADGQVCWVHLDGEGRQVLTRCGVEVDLDSCMRRAIPGLVLEFGVATGKSIRELAKSGRKIYGFDWWRGLPHDWNPGDQRGYLVCDKPKDLPKNVELIDGLFSDTLEGFLFQYRDAVSFVHIDCDLYCSTIYVLNCLKERFIKGSVIAFDEIDVLHLGERAAWARYCFETGQDWRLLGKQHQFGEVYEFCA